VHLLVTDICYIYIEMQGENCVKITNNLSPEEEPTKHTVTGFIITLFTLPQHVWTFHPPSSGSASKFLVLEESIITNN
jgi:hypothetical protein